MARSSIANNWFCGTFAVVLSSYAYFIFEWLFFVSKPSMLNSLALGDQLAVLFVAPIPLLLYALPVAFVLFILGSLFYLIRLRWPGKLLFVLVPTFILASTLFLVIDNFSYSIFRFASFSDMPFNRILYSAVLLALFVLSARFYFGQLFNNGFLSRSTMVGAAFSFLLLSASVAFGFISLNDRDASSGLGEAVAKPKKSYRNVIVFASDGISNSHMSLYGYKRKTTPYLDSIRKNLRIYENHFTNAARTTGSVGSLLSGKSPTTTRLIFRPDIFSGPDVYQHLPGILRSHGFDSADISVRHYADAADINMKNAFRYANGRNLDKEGLQIPRWFSRGFQSAAYFVEETYNRISGRLLHIAGIRTMSNPFMAVTQPQRNRRTDRVRVDNLKSFIRSARKPFFAHVHLFGTHGPRFPANTTKFTNGKKQTEDWMEDFYDDAVLQYDGYIKELVEFLKLEGVYDNTLLILNTDHGYRWSVDEPLPLIFRFPDNKFAGIVRNSSQRLDIGPSILDYLNIPQPAWMQGTSLFSAESRKLKPIFIVDRKKSAEVNGWRQVPSPSPPFYTLGSISMIYCDRMYTLDLTRSAASGNFLPQKVRHHTSPCNESSIPSDAKARDMLIEHLRQAKYELPGDLLK